MEPTTPPSQQPQQPAPRFARWKIIAVISIVVIILLGLGLYITTIWAKTNPNNATINGFDNSYIVKIHRWRCEQNGGQQYFSESGLYRCGWEPTSDGGKPCTASAQCEAGCYCDSDVVTRDCFQCAPYRRGASGTLYEDRYTTENANSNTNASTNQNTNVSTANWKTYTNKNFHFFFQYPPELQVREMYWQGNFAVTVSGEGVEPLSAISYDGVAVGTITFIPYVFEPDVQHALNIAEHETTPFSELYVHRSDTPLREFTLGGRVAYTIQTPNGASSISPTTKLLHTVLRNANDSYFISSTVDADARIEGNDAPAYYERILNTLTFTSEPPTWITYDSQSSSLQRFKELRPSFSVQYLDDWQVDEELGGLFLSEDGHHHLEPHIAIGWSDTSIRNDPTLADQCKRALVGAEVDSSNVRNTTLGGQTGVQLTIDETNEIIACANYSNVLFIISGHPADAEFVQKNFDRILESITFSN